MGQITKRGEYQWRAKVRRKGFPEQSRTFTYKEDAEKWVRTVESELETKGFIDRREAEKNTLAAILRRYQQEITPGKKSAAIESVKIDVLLRDAALVGLKMTALTSTEVAKWRDRRLKEVTGGTVNREIDVLSTVLNHARREWGSLAALARACRSPAVARTRLFGWLVFNVLVGNSDAHLKNLSFLVSHEGVQLAPFYDLLSVATYDSLAFDKNGWPAQTPLAWPILGVHRFSDIRRGVLLEAGGALNLAKGTAGRLLENLRDRVMPEAEALYAEVEAENARIVQMCPKLSTTLAGELRCLRAILHTVLKEMAKQIA